MDTFADTQEKGNAINPNSWGERLNYLRGCDQKISMNGGPPPENPDNREGEKKNWTAVQLEVLRPSQLAKTSAT